MPTQPLTSCWVILTIGDRPLELSSAVASIRLGTASERSDIVVIHNGSKAGDLEGVRSIELLSNQGIPGGRDVAMKLTKADVVFFLDDDARVIGNWPSRVLDDFQNNDRLAAVSTRIVDELGRTSRRHVPRLGRRGLTEGGPVTTFLGGASAIRRTAYENVGGYWPQLWYGHEEQDLSWRLLDDDWEIRYDPDAIVFHPQSEISRHPDGWRLTGRNRVWIARRNLPRPIALLHSLVWLTLGCWRAPKGPCRKSYVQGWGSGWRTVEWGEVHRTPIAWSTVGRLTRLGRPPIL